MDIAQYTLLKHRQQLLQTLAGIAAAEGRGYAQNSRTLSRPAADPYTRLGRAAGLVMVTGMARRAALQQAAAASAGRPLQSGVKRAQSIVQQRLRREKQMALAQFKAQQQNRATAAAMLKKLAAIEKNLKKTTKKKKK